MERSRIVPDQKNIVNRVGTVIIRVDIRDPTSSSRRCQIRVVRLCLRE